MAGLKVFFTGEQFDQSDLDVYLEILNMARNFPLGTPIQFSAHSLLKALGISTGGREHAWLHSVLIRLCGGVVDATDHGQRYFGQLLHGGIRNELTMNYTIKINPDFAVLFGFGLWSKINLGQRRAMGRNNTAKALHAYYSSHINPSAHKIQTLAKLAGLANSNKRQVKATHRPHGCGLWITRQRRGNPRHRNLPGLSRAGKQKARRGMRRAFLMPGNLEWSVSPRYRPFV